MPATEASGIPVRGVGEVEFSGEDDVVPFTLARKRFAKNALTLITGIDVCSINKVYAFIDRMIDNPERSLLFRFSPKHHSAETKLTNF